MAHKYKILSADVANGTFVIEFEGKRPLNFWIPHNEAGFLTGDALEQAIQLLYPQDADIEPKFTKFTNGSEIESLVTPKEKTQADVRMHRDALLLKSDWTQLSDAPLTAEQKAEWATYRQALRDITKQSGFPNEVSFPVSPI